MAARRRLAVEALQRAGQKVAFVGDGIDDAPALVRADMAAETAGVILMSGDLRGFRPPLPHPAGLVTRPL